MTALRKGDIVAIVGKITGISENGAEAEVNFHEDPAYGPDDVVVLHTAGLRLMEHGDPDFGVKIIDGVEGEWKIQSRLSQNVAVMQRLGSDANDHDNFQVVSVDRLKTQDKDLYRLVTGAELHGRGEDPGNDDAATERTPQADATAPAPVLRAPSLSVPPAPAPQVPAPASTPAIPPVASLPMMRPDKISAPSQDGVDSPAAVDASIAQTAREDERIVEVADMSRDPLLGGLVHKAGHLAETRSASDQAAPVRTAPAAEPAAPALRTPSLTLSQPQSESAAGKVDLSSIAESESEFSPPAA